ncbi:hypothetical protein [Actinacidiphila soli]|uniref:hypothetical protein n=1 Tax=Actinacidiphila soli TaxID=2487275 RepID=UPI0013E35B1C|nr:hypothetical protein [Actinacidiphila soli]
MTDLPPAPDSRGTTGVGPGRGPAPITPRWVKVSGIIAGVLVVAFVVMHIAGGGMGGHH